MNSNKDPAPPPNPIVTGFGQVADLERGGAELNLSVAAEARIDCVGDGYTCFDMADSIGTAVPFAAHAMITRYSRSGLQLLIGNRYDDRSL